MLLHRFWLPRFCVLVLGAVALSATATDFAHHRSDGHDPHSSAQARLGGDDSDGDGVDDFFDNCRFLSNPAQRDTDEDGYGNACDTDLNNDGTTNAQDLGLLRSAFFTAPGVAGWNPNADFNGDNVINVIDLGALRASFFDAPGPSGMSCAGTSPCPPRALELVWPMQGDDAAEWVINNYVDLDPTSGIRDYRGGAKTYDGHRGIDIDVPTFRAMDDDYPIRASAQGVVLALTDENFDRNTTCVGSWNFVTVGHPNGWKTIYGHLKRHSVVVSVGDIVEPGTVLGVVGSSGCSTAPHLHLETVDRNGMTVEPFAAGMWANRPVYDTEIGFMDASLQPNAISDVDMIKDPPANATIVAPGTTLGVGLSMGGGRSGDTVNLRLVKDGSVVSQHNINFNQTYRHTYWWWNYPVPASASGAHQLQIRVNGSLAQTYNVDFEPTLTGFYQVRHGVPAASYQALFDTMTANGYRPVWVDGYESNGSTFYNAIFNQSTVTSWAAAHGMTSSSYQNYFTAQTQAGRRLVHVDSYRQSGSVRYAAIFVEQFIGPQWTAYHNATAAQHQSLFNSNVGQGFRAAMISVVDLGGGNLRYTALYDKANVGGWVAVANMTTAQYQTQFNAQVAAGRRLAYINGYSNNGTANITAVWNSVQPASWVARHNLTSAQFQTEFDNWTGQGLGTRMISGYQNGGVTNFAGYWTN
ncbi:MAG: peptidoglycan DD-metalloendopeptidase family protein [Gammaproteobacteria bacterium]